MLFSFEFPIITLSLMSRLSISVPVSVFVSLSPSPSFSVPLSLCLCLGLCLSSLSCACRLLAVGLPLWLRLLLLLLAAAGLSHGKTRLHHCYRPDERHTLLLLSPLPLSLCWCAHIRGVCASLPSISCINTCVSPSFFPAPSIPIYLCCLHCGGAVTIIVTERV